MADFIPAVKGVGYRPGWGGLKDAVMPGSRGIANQLRHFKGGIIDAKDGGNISYWWNLGPEQPKDIYEIALGAIQYANAARDAKEAASAVGTIKPHLAHGISAEQFIQTMQSPEQAGTIVFSRLDPQWTEIYKEGDFGDGVQTAIEATPFRKLALPPNITHTLTGGHVIIGSEQFRLSSDVIREGHLHDFVKEFAQNLKDTIGPDGVLPAGTQEVLDAPTMQQGTDAFRAYLVSIGRAEEFPEATLTSIMPDKDRSNTFLLQRT